MSIIDIVNAIRAEGSADYQKYVPLATRGNIADVGNPIKEYQIFMNEFVNALINKIGLVVVRKRLLSNPLAPLKKGTMPLGFDVEEAHVNRATAEKFDPEGKSLLTRVTPDVAVMYHRLNRQDMYQVTVSKEQLGQAFTSWENLQKLLDGIISSMYDGDSDDEFILMKNLFADAVTNEHVVTSELPDLTEPDSATAIVKAFKNASTFMTFAGSSFNKFHVVNEGETPRRLKTEKEDQVIILRADLATAIDVDVLANAFNMDKANFLAQRVIVDNFGSAENVGAFICDKNFVQVYDQQRLTEEFYNPAGLYYNYFYHVWQVVSYSMLVNALAFVFPEPEEP